MYLINFVFCSLLVIYLFLGSSSNSFKDTNDGLHLPSFVAPFHQFVHLQPFVNGSSTLGFTQISITAKENASAVSFHKAGIDIEESSILITRIDTDEKIPTYGTYYNNANQIYTIILDSQALTIGTSYTVALNFTAYLNDNLFGFYKSYYTNEDGQQVDFAVSQFAPIYARWSFPCFDEPAQKIPFSIQIETPKNLTAISNMPLSSSIDISNKPFRREDTFQETPIMSTYLVAFLVADFVHQTSIVNDVTFGVWTTSSSISQAQYALHIAPNIVQFYDDYFLISYASMMPKLDMAAVPDFYYGAMENWGLIIYRETAMLYDSEQSSAKDKQGVCSIIAHELAHQWFGNLVTFEWWNDVWLNEGFATFMEYLGCDAVEPSFGMVDQFLIGDLQKSFQIDSLASSKPLSPNITKLSQIYDVYNTIAYSKGSSVIRMMDYFLTPNTFRSGLRNYLNAHSYSNAKHDDLWSALTNQGHIDGTLDQNLTVKEIMDPWVLQPGYPVLNVQKINNTTLVLTQKRFLLDSNGTGSFTNETWWIPLTYVIQSDPDFSKTIVSQWMNKRQLILTNVTSLESEWIIFNVQQNGYYRVNYDASNWKLLISQFQFNYSAINTLNRAQILDDGYTFARTGALDYETILSINSYLGDEQDYVPMKTALDRLNYLYSMFERTEANSSFKDYMLFLTVPLYNEYGFDDSLQDPHEVQLKRELVVRWSCKLGFEPCTSNATELYSIWMSQPNNNSVISPNLRVPVICTAIENGGELQWDFAYEQYLTSDLANQRASLIYGMGCVTQNRLINRYLNLTFSDKSGIRQQDIKNVFQSLSENVFGRDIAWDFIRNNTDMIASYMGSYQSVVDLTEIVSESFNTVDKLNELNQFDLEESSKLGEGSLDQSEEVVQNNINWMTDYYQVIVTWLNDNGFGLNNILEVKQ